MALSYMQMITPICKLVSTIRLSARSRNLAGKKNLAKTIKGNLITPLSWRGFFFLASLEFF